MLYELAIPFSRPLRRVVLADAEAPAPPPPVAPSPKLPVDPEKERQKEEQRRQEAERQQVTAVLAALTEVTRSLETEHRKRWIEMERAAVEIAVAVASRLLHQKIEAGDFAVESLVRSIVVHLAGEQPTTVFLHPDDLALLRRRVPDEQALSSGNRPLRLSADPALGRGHCRAQAGDVSILSQLEMQLADLHRHLQGSVLHEYANP